MQRARANRADRGAGVARGLAQRAQPRRARHRAGAQHRQGERDTRGSTVPDAKEHRERHAQVGGREVHSRQAHAQTQGADGGRPHLATGAVHEDAHRQGTRDRHQVHDGQHLAARVLPTALLQEHRRQPRVDRVEEHGKHREVHAHRPRQRGAQHAAHRDRRWGRLRTGCRAGGIGGIVPGALRSAGRPAILSELHLRRRGTRTQLHPTNLRQPQRQRDHRKNPPAQQRDPPRPRGPSDRQRQPTGQRRARVQAHRVDTHEDAAPVRIARLNKRRQQHIADGDRHAHHSHADE